MRGINSWYGWLFTGFMNRRNYQLRDNWLSAVRNLNRLRREREQWVKWGGRYIRRQDLNFFVDDRTSCLHGCCDCGQY